MEASPQHLAQLYNTMVIKPNIKALNGQILLNNVPKIVEGKVAQMLQNKQRYQAISRQYSNPLRWYHIAMLHELECTQNFNCYLGNGQPLRQKTTIVPKGRGPFKTFEAGAKDAIELKGLNTVQDWSIGNTLYILESFNGFGYEKYHNTNSPYIFSGSQHYTAGKYTRDGHYNANAVSTQIGIALLLKHLEDIGEMKP